MLKIVELVGERPTVCGPGFFGRPGLVELRWGDDVAATLRHKLVSLGAATGTSADGAWEFESHGIWHATVVVRRAGSNSEVSVFKYDSGLSFFGIPVFGSPPRGTFLGTDGCEYSVRWDRFKDFDLSVSDAAGETLIHYTQDRTLEKPVAQIDIRNAAATIADLPWMVMLGLFIQIAARSAAAAGYGPL